MSRKYCPAESTCGVHLCRFLATVAWAGEAATTLSLGGDGCTQQRLRQAQFMCSLAARLILIRREQVMSLLVGITRILSRRLPALEGYVAEALEVWVFGLHDSLSANGQWRPHSIHLRCRLHLMHA
jgi:hypothetical protein